MRKKKAEAAPEVELPITPMLDMAFQLLAFFVFTYHPSALEGQMEMALPAAGEAKADKPENVSDKAPDMEMEVPSEITIIIKARPGTGDRVKEQTPFQYLVETREGTTPPMTNDSESGVSALKRLEDYLIEARKALGNKEDVKIKADSTLKYVYVMEVMDICHNPKKGGFKRVGFAPPPDM